MKIVNENPPNFEQICDAIPEVRGQEGIVFTYGDTVYNPSNAEIEDHLEVHESVHIKQQREIGADEWWSEYLKNAKFRLEQELEAYRDQYQMVKKEYGREQAKNLLKQVARDLSSGMYGNILSYKEARKLIMK